MTDARVTQTATEQFGPGDPRAQLTQAGVEMWANATAGLSLAVATAVSIEQWVTLAAAAPPAAVSQSAVSINTG